MAAISHNNYVQQVITTEPSSMVKQGDIPGEIPEGILEIINMYAASPVAVIDHTGARPFSSSVIKARVLVDDGKRPPISLKLTSPDCISFYKACFDSDYLSTIHPDKMQSAVFSRELNECLLKRQKDKNYDFATIELEFVPKVVSKFIGSCNFKGAKDSLQTALYQVVDDARRKLKSGI